MMNKFNQLYNLILQSIISQNKATRKQMLANVPDSQAIQQYLNTLDNKIADFIAKFFKSGQLKSLKDKNIQKIIAILKRNTTFNIQTKITLKDFLKQNKQYITRQQNSNINIIEYIDTKIPEFSQKQQLEKGVIIYKVQDSKQGQNAVRKVVDICWGYDANPWCLISRNADYDSEKFWSQYNAYPKHIAFQNGQLLAFCANRNKKACWWDRQDNSSEELKLLDGSKMQVKTVGGTPEEIFQEWLDKNNLVYNPKTDRYDCKEGLYLTDTDIIDGHFPVKFGVINGNFICQDCKSLISLQGAPTKVKGDISYTGCTNLPNYKQLRLQEYIQDKKLIYNKKTKMYDCKEDLSFSYPCSNEAIKSGKIPIKIGKVNGDFKYSWFGEKASFINFPEEVIGNFELIGAKKITNLKGCPKKVGGDFIVSCCDVTSLEGCPEEVQGDFGISSNDNLINLKGAPKLIHGDVNCSYCANLTSVQGLQQVDGEINIRKCPKFKE